MQVSVNSCDLTSLNQQPPVTIATPVNKVVSTATFGDDPKKCAVFEEKSGLCQSTRPLQPSSTSSCRLSQSDQNILELKNLLLARLQSVEDDGSMLLEGKKKSEFLQNRSYRGSKFRGVSKNGSKWQVMIVRGNQKKYIGAIEDEDVAGVLYDKYAIIIQGLQVSSFKALSQLSRV